jgi:hypothetical protein
VLLRPAEAPAAAAAADGGGGDVDALRAGGAAALWGGCGEGAAGEACGADDLAGAPAPRVLLLLLIAEESAPARGRSGLGDSAA